MGASLLLQLLAYFIFVTSTYSIPSRFSVGHKPRQFVPPVSSASIPQAPSPSASGLASRYAFYNQTGYFPPILLSIGQVSAPREMPLPQYLCVRRLAIRIHSMVVSFSILNKQVTRQPSTRCQSFCFREPSLYMSVTLVQLPYRWDDLTLKQQPCYPESAVVIGSNPPLMNPGTDVPNTPNPGTNCNDPGPYHGAYSLGNRFPIYVVATHCSNKDEWRINYNAYYV